MSKRPSLVPTPASEYAKQHGLAVKSLYYWRRKLEALSNISQRAGNTAKPIPSGKFVALQVITARPVNCALAWPSGLRFEMSTLPSPEWLADLAREAQAARTVEEIEALLPWNLHAADLTIEMVR